VIRVIASACLSALLCGLTGCVQLPTRADPVKVLAPRIDTVPAADWPAVDWSLAVQRPLADQTRGSVRLVVRSANAQLAFYPGVAWLDDLPDLLQSALLRGFSDSGRIGAVDRPGVALARYHLATDVRSFDAVTDGAGGLTVMLEVRGVLVEVRSGRMLTSRTFSTSAPVSGAGVDALTGAFEAALTTLVSSVVGWTLSAIPADP
jgi:cholesterol transport system auxiliary component